MDENEWHSPRQFAWNDPVLAAAEGARCPCGHEALDHTWIGCEECACAKSGIHAVLVSGAVQIRVKESD